MGLGDVLDGGAMNHVCVCVLECAQFEPGTVTSGESMYIQLLLILVLRWNLCDTSRWRSRGVVSKMRIPGAAVAVHQLTFIQVVNKDYFYIIYAPKRSIFIDGFYGDGCNSIRY